MLTKAVCRALKKAEEEGFYYKFQASLDYRIRPCTKQRGREESMSVLGRETARSRPRLGCWSYPAGAVALAGSSGFEVWVV